jgi:hypothetical protein
VAVDPIAWRLGTLEGLRVWIVRKSRSPKSHNGSHSLDLGVAEEDRRINTCNIYDGEKL